VTSRRAALPIVLLSSTPALAQDTGDLAGEDRLNVALAYTLDTYDDYWIGDTFAPDESATFSRIDRHALSLWASYGVTSYLDLTANLAFVHVSLIDSFADGESSLQDLVLGPRVRLFGARLGPFALTFVLAPAVKLPMADYESNAIGAIGDAQVDLRARAIARIELPSRFFLAVEGGWDARLGAPAPEAAINVSAGAVLFDRLHVAAHVMRLDSFGEYDIGRGDFPGVEEDWIKVGLAAHLAIGGLTGVTARAATTLAGKNTGDVDSVSIGVAQGF